MINCSASNLLEDHFGRKFIQAQGAGPVIIRQLSEVQLMANRATLIELKWTSNECSLLTTKINFYKWGFII